MFWFSVYQVLSDLAVSLTGTCWAAPSFHWRMPGQFLFDWWRGSSSCGHPGTPCLQPGGPCGLIVQPSTHLQHTFPAALHAGPWQGPPALTCRAPQALQMVLSACSLPAPLKGSSWRVWQETGEVPPPRRGGHLHQGRCCSPQHNTFRS